jgi:hypothetical protein
MARRLNFVGDEKKMMMKQRWLFTITVLTVLLFIAAVPTASADPGWWDDSWQYREMVTIDHTKVDSDLENFPVLVKIDSTSDLDFSKVAGSSGEDIRFVASDDSTELKYEIERWDDSNNLAEIWVKIPSVSSSSDTEFYLYYGNSGASDGQSVTDVWNSNFKMVQHLQETPGDDAEGHDDSTSNNNDGTPKNFHDDGGGTTDSAGKIDGADDFAGDDDYVEVDHDSSLDITQWTLEAWVYPESGADEIIYRAPGGDITYQMQYHDSHRNVDIWFEESGGSDHYVYSSTDSVPLNQWTYVAGTYDGSDIKVYINSGFDDSTSTTATPNTGSAAVRIGRGDGGYFNGKLDEVRISNTARSAAWLKAVYYSENDNLLTYENQENYWWDSDWDYRKKITIDHDKVDSTLSDFPTLVKIDSISDLDFSKVEGSSGQDIRFTNTGGTTEYKYEIERWDDSNNLAEIWVKIPSVSSNTNTEFYMYYGNSEASDNQDAESVWDSNFKMVQHLQENTIASDGLKDSTSNNNDGTPSWTKHNIDMDLDYARGVFVYDIDGDSNPDVVVAGFSADDVVWYEALDDPTGSWTKHNIDTNLDGVRGVFVYDIDGDGNPDVVATGYHVDDVVWYEAPDDPTGSWTKHNIDTNLDEASGVFVYDIDGDGNPDVVATGERADDVVWYEAPDDPTGTWTKHNIDTNLVYARGVYVYDIDDDSNPDVVATGIFADDVVWYEAPDDPTGTWTKHNIDTNLKTASYVFVYDIDGDSNPDVVATNAYSKGVVWYEAPDDPTGSWTKHNIDTNLDDAEGVFVYDIDGDGNPDVAASGHYADDVVWYEAPDDPKEAWTKHNIDTDLDGAFGVFVYDIDGDSNPDVVSTGIFADDVVWYELKNLYTTSGKIDGAYDFDGNGDYVTVADDSSIRETGDVTVEFWARADSLSSNPSMVSFGADGETEATNILYGVVIKSDGKLKILHEYGGGSNEFHTTTSSYITTGSWYHVSAVRDTTADTWKVYVDGELKESLSYSNEATGGTSGKIWIGSWVGSSGFFDGKIDEVRISNTPRSAAWIETSYYSGNDRLLSFGAEEGEAELCTGCQRWYLSSTGGSYVMYKGNNSKTAGTVTVGDDDEQIWRADENATCNLSFPADTWTGHITFDAGSNDTTVRVWVGEWNGSQFTPSAAGENATINGSGDFSISAGEFNVSTGEWLAFRIQDCDADGNSSVVSVGLSSSYLTSGGTDPAYPIPELPAMVLFLVGVLVLAGYVVLRGKKEN